MGAVEVPYGATGLEDQAPVGATAQVEEAPTAPHVADDEATGLWYHEADEVGVAEYGVEAELVDQVEVL